MLRTDRLWAKSWNENYDGPPPNHVFLAQHLADVCEAAKQVLACTGDDQLRAVGLTPNEWRERFNRIVVLAAAVHDLGKANDHFQGMITGRRDVCENPQGLRHEWVSVLMLGLPEIRRWLLPAVSASETDWQIMLWAIAGHHPAYGRPSPPFTSPCGAGPQIEWLLGHADFRRCLNAVRSALKINEESPVLKSLALPLIHSASVFAKQIVPWSIRSRMSWDSLKELDRRFVPAVKACLIGADVAGSALPRTITLEDDRNAWIGRAFATTPPPGRIQRIVDRRCGNKPLYPFQTAVASSTAPVTFVRAGCGSGKTLAAYQWAASQHPGRRLYICYPTTGTATEGYRDYLYAPEEEFDAGLFHGRAAVDLDIILGVRAEDDDGESDALARIESLDSWSTPIVACTVDTVLGLVQNNRRGLYAWPALAGAAFVFDEIHAYDAKLFGALIRFIQGAAERPNASDDCESSR